MQMELPYNYMEHVNKCKMALHDSSFFDEPSFLSTKKKKKKKICLLKKNSQSFFFINI